MTDAQAAYQQASDRIKAGVYHRQRSAAADHMTKQFICQLQYNRMEITDLDQMTPGGIYQEV